MRVAALLRGINLGPNRRIGMPVLREIVSGLGHDEVETYLQSGNVVFRPAHGDAGELEEELSRALAETTGHDVAVVVRTAPELGALVAGNPYEVDDPTRLVVAFLGDAVGLPQLGLDDLAAYAPDELTLAGKHVYVSLPNGQARSKLMEALTKRRLPTTVTVRNWRTVTALADLTSP